MKKDDCLFCKIANGDSPSRTLYEDERFRVIKAIMRLQQGRQYFTSICI